VAALVGVQTAPQRLIGHALHVDVQRGVDAQAALVHRLRAVGCFEVFPDFLEKIGRQVIAWILQVQAERRLDRGGFLLGPNFPLFSHPV
jgi:hypothetical protein